MKTTYLMRELRVEISTTLANPELEIKRRLDISEIADVVPTLLQLLDEMRRSVSPLLSQIKLSSDTDPGDEPLLQVEIEYAELPDDADGLVTSFSVLSTETFHAEKKASTLPNAIQSALRGFCKHINKLTVEAA